jgi:hypothetical protein
MWGMREGLEDILLASLVAGSAVLSFLPGPYSLL